MDTIKEKMREEQKLKILESMKAHLSSVGWTGDGSEKDCEVAMAELPGLWRKLLNEGLAEDALRAGYDFKQFVRTAKRMLNLKLFNFEVRFS